MDFYEFIDDGVAMDVVPTDTDPLEHVDEGDFDAPESTDFDDIDEDNLTADFYAGLLPEHFNVGGDYEDHIEIDSSTEGYEHLDDVHDEGIHENHSGTISFKGNGRCRVCGCGKWAGYGNTCANCGHFYDKHI